MFPKCHEPTRLAKIYPVTHVVYEVTQALGIKSFSPVMGGLTSPDGPISEPLATRITTGIGNGATSIRIETLENARESGAVTSQSCRRWRRLGGLSTLCSLLR